MGTETAYPIGTILTRKKPQGDDLDELRVTGGGKQLVVTPNQGFGANFQLDAAKARAEYDTDIPEGVYLSQPTYINPGPTPEQVFSGETTEGDGLSRIDRAAAQARTSEDPRTEMESAKTDTGIPTVLVPVDESVPANETPLERSARAGRKGAAAARAKKSDDNQEEA